MTKRSREMVQLLEALQPGGTRAEVLSGFRSQYELSSREERHEVFLYLLRQMEVQRPQIETSLRAVMDARRVDAVEWSGLLTQLRRGLESPRMRLFRQFLNLSGGLQFLLDFRGDVLVAQREASLDLAPLDEEIAYLFNSWFQHGFLFLHEITQDSSYRQIRFLKEHELVHPMASLEEMGDRLGEDRRLFALFHRALPEEPIVFIEVALTRHLVRSIQDILHHRETDSRFIPDTAIFYSINNTQNGLAGLGLGKLLIFQVVDAIKKDYPHVQTFATLSPMTGFWERYLRPILEGDDERFTMKRAQALELFPQRTRRALHGGNDGNDPAAVARSIVETLSRPDWIQDEKLHPLVRRPLTELGFHYLTKEKNRDGKPINPVANFHLGNGARVTQRQVNFGGNLSERGLKDSCGLMVNYLYSSSWLHDLRRTARSLLSWES